VRNDIFYNVKMASGSSLTIGGTRSHNWYYGSGSQSEASVQNGTRDPFVNRASGDYRLAAPTDAGLDLGVTYRVDMNGVTRAGDGRWDRGALEYSGSLTRAPSSPQDVRIIR
jgi:hypothetical protein